MNLGVLGIVLMKLKIDWMKLKVMGVGMWEVRNIEELVE